VPLVRETDNGSVRLLLGIVVLEMRRQHPAR
jgi:hypothetical protein